MLFRSGGDLSEIDKNAPGISKTHSLRDAAKGLVELHECLLSHNDIKADNVFINKSQKKALLADLGCASPLSTASAEKDIQMFGLMLHEVLSGSNIFDSEGHSDFLLRKSEFNPIPKEYAHVPEHLQKEAGDLIKSCLYLDGSKRVSSQELLSKLDALLKKTEGAI